MIYQSMKAFVTQTHMSQASYHVSIITLPPCLLISPLMLHSGPRTYKLSWMLKIGRAFGPTQNPQHINVVALEANYKGPYALVPCPSKNFEILTELSTCMFPRLWRERYTCPHLVVMPYSATILDNNIPHGLHATLGYPRP